MGNNNFLERGLNFLFFAGSGAGAGAFIFPIIGKGVEQIVTHQTPNAPDDLAFMASGFVGLVLASTYWAYTDRKTYGRTIIS